MKRFLGALCCVSSLSAEIVFDSDLVELKVGVSDQSVTAEFPFVVKDRDTEIRNYDAPCSCLKAQIYPLNNDRSTKLKWKVGETGKVIGKFSIGNFKGTIDKAIVLNFLGEKEGKTLTVRVHVPEWVKIDPPTQQWNVGEDIVAKDYKITVNHTEPIHIIKHSGTSDDFPYTIKTIKEGWEYVLTVTPTQNESPAMGMIRFHTDSKSSRFQRNQIFAVMRTPRAAAAK